ITWTISVAGYSTAVHAQVVFRLGFRSVAAPVVCAVEMLLNRVSRRFLVLGPSVSTIAQVRLGSVIVGGPSTPTVVPTHNSANWLAAMVMLAVMAVRVLPVPSILPDVPEVRATPGWLSAATCGTATGKAKSNNSAKLRMNLIIEHAPNL